MASITLLHLSALLRNGSNQWAPEGMLQWKSTSVRQPTPMKGSRLGT